MREKLKTESGKQKSGVEGESEREVENGRIKVNQGRSK
jgi:hypothetical protein